MARQAGRPAWVIAKQSQEYPAAAFLTGSGLAASAAEAEHLARLDLITRLKAEIRKELERRVAGTDPESRWLRVEAAEEWVTEPAGLRLALAWRSQSGQHAALAVVERQELAAALREQIRALEAEADRAIRASSAASATQPYAGLLQVLGAWLSLTQAEEQRAALAAVAPTWPEARSQAGRAAELDQALGTALAALDLFAPTSAAWRAGEEGRTALLLCGVRTKGDPPEPLGGVPLRFSAAPVPGAPQGFTAQTRTDAAGLARVEVDAAGLPTPDARIAFQVGLDGPGVLEEAGLAPGDPRCAPWLELVSAPRASMVLQRPVAGGARVALLVAELRSGDFQPSSRAGQAMARALAGHGLRPMQAGELRFELAGEPTPEHVAAALSDQAELALYGVVQTTPEDRLAGGLVFVLARGEMWALRLPAGQVLGRFEGQARGAGLTVEQAEGRSLDAFAREALETLLPSLTLDRPSSSPASGAKGAPEEGR